MKKFMAVYTGSPEAMAKSGWEALSDAERKARQTKGVQAWGEWMTRHQASIVETGGPLGKTRKVGPRGITDIRNQLTGYVVVQAESHEAAARLFEGHPHFSIFPGDSAEVMEILPIPNQPG